MELETTCSKHFAILPIKKKLVAQVRKVAWLQLLKMGILQTQGLSRPHSQLKFSMEIGGNNEAIH